MAPRGQQPSEQLQAYVVQIRSGLEELPREARGEYLDMVIEQLADLREQSLSGVDKERLGGPGERISELRSYLH